MPADPINPDYKRPAFEPGDRVSYRNNASNFIIGETINGGRLLRLEKEVDRRAWITVDPTFVRLLQKAGTFEPLNPPPAPGLNLASQPPGAEPLPSTSELVEAITSKPDPKREEEVILAEALKTSAAKIRSDAAKPASLPEDHFRDQLVMDENGGLVIDGKTGKVVGRISNEALRKALLDQVRIPPAGAPAHEAVGLREAIDDLAPRGIPLQTAEEVVGRQFGVCKMDDPIVPMDPNFIGLPPVMVSGGPDGSFNHYWIAGRGGVRVKVGDGPNADTNPMRERLYSSSFKLFDFKPAPDAVLIGWSQSKDPRRVYSNWRLASGEEVLSLSSTGPIGGDEEGDSHAAKPQELKREYAANPGEKIDMPAIDTETIGRMVVEHIGKMFNEEVTVERDGAAPFDVMENYGAIIARHVIAYLEPFYEGDQAAAPADTDAQGNRTLDGSKPDGFFVPEEMCRRIALMFGRVDDWLISRSPPAGRTSALLKDLRALLGEFESRMLDPNEKH